MSRKRYSPEQIIGLLREAEVLLSQGKKTGEVCRHIGYRSRATIAGGGNMAASGWTRQNG